MVESDEVRIPPGCRLVIGTMNVITITHDRVRVVGGQEKLA